MKAPIQAIFPGKFPDDGDVQRDFVMHPDVQTAWLEVDGVLLLIRRPTADKGVIVEAFEKGDNERIAAGDALDELVVYEKDIADLKECQVSDSFSEKTEVFAR